MLLGCFSLPILSTFFIGPLNSILLCILLSTFCLFIWIAVSNESGLLVVAAFFGAAVGGLTGLIPSAALKGTFSNAKEIYVPHLHYTSPRTLSQRKSESTISSQNTRVPQSRKAPVQVQPQAPLRYAFILLALALACLSGPPIGGALAGARQPSLVQPASPSSLPPVGGSGGATSINAAQNTPESTSTSSSSTSTSLVSIAWGMPTGVATTPSEWLNQTDADIIDKTKTSPNNRSFNKGSTLSARDAVTKAEREFLFPAQIFAGASTAVGAILFLGARVWEGGWRLAWV